jgi:NADH dehydrogenase
VARLSAPHVVILGGGFGGLSAAKVLGNAPVQVTLIDRHNYHLFQPLLYQVATATLSPGDIASPIRWVLRRARNIRVLLGDVASIDAARRLVRLSDGAEVAYDYLIVATGASHTYFGHDEWASDAPGLKTLEDALEIRRRVLLAFERAERETDPARRQELLTFVLVGGGPTGVELAGTLAEIARRTLRDQFRTFDPRSARIVLVEAGPTILGGFPQKLRDAARASLRRLDVEVLEGSAVTSVDAYGVTCRRAERATETLADGQPGEAAIRPVAGPERIVARTVLWTAGVAASPVLATLGAPRDRAGRVKVEPDLSIPDHPDVFVVGDAAVFEQDGHPLPGVAQTAMQQARHAARMILRRARGEQTMRFVFHDKGSMAIIGRGSAIADLGWVRFAGPLAWLAWLFLHIFMLIGFRNRLAVMLQWAVAYFTFQRSVRLITGSNFAIRNSRE